MNGGHFFLLALTLSRPAAESLAELVGYPCTDARAKGYQVMLQAAIGDGLSV